MLLLIKINFDFIIHTYARLATLYVYIRTCVANIGDTLQMQNLTKSYMKTLKQDCKGLHELLLSGNAVKFTEVIGEGSYVFKIPMFVVVVTYICLSLITYIEDVRIIINIQ